MEKTLIKLKVHRWAGCPHEEVVNMEGERVDPRLVLSTESSAERSTAPYPCPICSDSCGDHNWMATNVVAPYTRHIHNYPSDQQSAPFQPTQVSSDHQSTSFAEDTAAVEHQYTPNPYLGDADLQYAVHGINHHAPMSANDYYLNTSTHQTPSSSLATPYTSYSNPPHQFNSSHDPFGNFSTKHHFNQVDANVDGYHAYPSTFFPQATSHTGTVTASNNVEQVQPTAAPINAPKAPARMLAHKHNRPCPEANPNCHWHYSVHCHANWRECEAAEKAIKVSWDAKNEWKGAPLGWNQEHAACIQPGSQRVCAYHKWIERSRYGRVRRFGGQGEYTYRG